jgi:hypothetical protein
MLVIQELVQRTSQPPVHASGILEKRKGKTVDKARNLTVISTFVRYLFRNIRKTAKEEARSLKDVRLPKPWRREERRTVKQSVSSAS